MRLPRFMITAASSGSGKTLITCGLLQAFLDKDVDVVSFKCGPDYIDPMFHEQVIGAKSRNLDAFFTPNDLPMILANGAKESELAILEGVMGYYDGLGGVTSTASAYDVAEKTDTPVILVVNCKGVSVSILPIIKGFLSYKEDSHIKGILLNQLSGMRYAQVKEMVERECQVPVYGYIPVVKECVLESRHLGLILPEEIEDLRGRIQALAKVLQETVDLDGLYDLAVRYEELEKMQSATSVEEENARKKEAKSDDKGLVRIAIARDEAFCFIYEENLQVLRENGAELVYFSPLHDAHLPKDIDGFILYGGYPELYARELYENQTMRREIRQAIQQEMPCMAECGGFMYLHEHIEGMDGQMYEMSGVIQGTAANAKKLSHFGYITLCEGTVFGKEIGEIRAHEFHYYQSSNNGEVFKAKKPIGTRSWRAMHSTTHLLAGFPHLYYRANMQVVQCFCERAGEYRDQAHLPDAE